MQSYEDTNKRSWTEEDLWYFTRGFSKKEGITGTLYQECIRRFIKYLTEQYPCTHEVVHNGICMTCERDLSSPTEHPHRTYNLAGGRYCPDCKKYIETAKVAGLPPLKADYKELTDTAKRNNMSEEEALNFVEHLRSNAQPFLPKIKMINRVDLLTNNATQTDIDIATKVNEVIKYVNTLSKKGGQ